MTKLRNMAVVAVLAAFASTAQAQEGGWNTKYGLLFDLQNIFQNGSAGVIGSYGGGVGATGVGVGVGVQMNLAPTRALRLFANVSRVSNPPYDSKTLTTTTKVVPDPTSVYNEKVGASYVLRLTTNTISPYAGVGASLRFEQSTRSGDAGTVGTPLTTYDNTNRTIGIGLDGTLGLEWRVHKAIAIFAEYLLDVTAIEYHKVDNNTTGATTSRLEYSQTKLLNFNTGVGQGGQIGVLAFF